jgi:nitric oxide reductase subunit B
MENGTIWGHGAYLGPDFSAQYLHTLALDTHRFVTAGDSLDMRAALVSETNHRPSVDTQVARLLAQNRYDPASGMQLTRRRTG